MPNIQPLPRENLAGFEPMFQAVEGAIGFVPNSYFTLGHRPDILHAFSRLAAAVLGPGEVDVVLKQHVAFMASSAAGCRYCQAHTSSGAVVRGGDPAKVEALFDFESSPLFSDAERAALRLARDAALQPNATTPEDFADLARHFSDAQAVEIVAVVSLFGFLNRWNDTMATQLEPEAREFASTCLGEHGWTAGKHA